MSAAYESGAGWYHRFAGADVTGAVVPQVSPAPAATWLLGTAVMAPDCSDTPAGWFRDTWPSDLPYRSTRRHGEDIDSEQLADPLGYA